MRPINYSNNLGVGVQISFHECKDHPISLTPLFYISQGFDKLAHQDVNTTDEPSHTNSCIF